MRYAVITIGRSGSSEFIEILNPFVNVIQKPDNHLYPPELFKKYGKNVKVIFITRNVKDVIKSVIQREKDNGREWISRHYKHLNSDFSKYKKILVEDTMNFERLYNAYVVQKCYDVLFIKYECLFFNHKPTIDAICKYVGIKTLSIKYNRNNIWKGNYNSNNKKSIELKWDKSLQDKLDSYDYKLQLANM